MTTVAVTPRSFRETPGEHHERLRESGLDVRFPVQDRPLDEREMVELVRGCVGLIVGIDAVSDSVLAAGPLHAVVKYGSGLDNIDLSAARRRNVRVEATPGANARSVAELAIALLMALARHVPYHDRVVRGGAWGDRRTGVELAGKRLGIVGYGAVGRETARLALAIGMEVTVCDPFISEAEATLASLEQLLETSDAVSLHVPLDETTRGLLGRPQLASMRPGALLVNTARGGLVDEEALFDALAAGHLAGAALDCFASEPPGDSPLLALETVIATPHVGAATSEAVRRAALEAVDKLVSAL
jgi:phosphoglycerate dehydrogenase-like enzyme